MIGAHLEEHALVNPKTPCLTGRLTKTGAYSDPIKSAKTPGSADKCLLPPPAGPPERAMCGPERCAATDNQAHREAYGSDLKTARLQTNAQPRSDLRRSLIFPRSKNCQITESSDCCNRLRRSARGQTEQQPYPKRRQALIQETRPRSVHEPRKEHPPSEIRFVNTA